MKKIILFSVLLLSNLLYSQWTQTLNGISIWSLAADLSGNVYAGSLGSASAIYKTTNLGINWITLTSANSQTVFSIAVDSAGNIFAANFSAGLMRSTNNGINFTTISTAAFGNSSVNAVACGRNGYVYAGTNGAGLFRSTDNGESWNPTGLTTVQVITIVPDNYNSSIIYAGTTSTSSGPNGFYRSSDYGATFSVNYNTGINVYGIKQMDQNTLITVSTSTGGPVHRSTNGGLNWIVACTGYVSRGICGSVYPNSVNISGNGGVFLSTNGGYNFISTGMTFSSTPVISKPAMIITGVSGSSNGGAWLHLEPVEVQPVSSEIPESFSLSQNYPNPFNPSAKINFSIPFTKEAASSGGRGVFTSLKIYNSLGQEITALVDQLLAPGTFQTEWNAADYPSGLYFYKLTSGDFSETKKMILLK